MGFFLSFDYAVNVNVNIRFMVFFPEGSDDSTSTPGHWHPCQTISFSTPWGAYNTSFGYRSADVLTNHICVHSPDLYLFNV